MFVRKELWTSGFSVGHCPSRHVQANCLAHNIENGSFPNLHDIEGQDPAFRHRKKRVTGNVRWLPKLNWWRWSMLARSSGNLSRASFSRWLWPGQGLPGSVPRRLYPVSSFAQKSEFSAMVSIKLNFNYCRLGDTIRSLPQMIQALGLCL